MGVSSVMRAARHGIEWRMGAALPPSRPSTMPDLIAACVAAHGARPVLVDGDERWSWQDLDRASAALAASLRDRLTPGERLVILAPNGIEHLLAELAAWRLGAVAAPLFAGFGAQRLRELLAHLAPRVALVADAAHAAQLPPGCEVLSLPRLRELARSGAAADRAVSARDACLIQHTSGSSGLPRGVVLAHDNLASQQAAFALLWPEVGHGDRLASYLPWHHSFGGLAERLWALCRGATLHLVPGGGRDRARFVASLREVAPTVFMSVPKMHAVAAAEGLFVRGQLRWAFTAGAPLPEDLFAWYASLGVRVHEGWGLTECSPSATITPPDEPRTPGVVGRPIPGVSVGVERGTGRILVRGPGVMLGYFRRESPCLAPQEDGEPALDSGDIGAWSEGGLRLAGRADHVLKLANGEKASAPEIEACLAHPSIHHAVVVADGELVALIDARPGHGDDEILAAIAAANAAQPEPWLRVARAYIAAQPWTIENGAITASMKVSRGTVVAAWRAWREQGGDAFRCHALRRSATG